jgi:hypothetical protein
MSERTSTASGEQLLAAVRQGCERAAGSGRPEAVLRKYVQPVLAEILSSRGARHLARDEMRLAVPAPAEAEELDAPLVSFGRADAIYNRFVIEFEPPGSLRPSLLHSATRHALAQVQQYLRGLSDHARLPLGRLAGCAFDGSWIVYVSFDGGDWRISRPRPADAGALTALIATLESLSSGRGLTAENLAEDFGPDSDVAGLLVPALADVLAPDSISQRAHAFFAQWRLDLGNAAGLPADLDLPDWLGLCNALRVSPETANRPQVLFALQTYFGIVAKLVSLVVLEGATGQDLLSGLTEAEDLWRGFEALESGVLTASTGTVNAIEPGIFSWYLASQTGALGTALHRAAEVATEYSAEVVEVTPLAARDLMKDLFQKLLPRALRHRLGEYYTPDWLAEFVLDEVGYSGDPSRTLLDPACGSGTFLVVAIAQIRNWFETHRETCGFSEDDLLQKILRAVTGFDLSPLAVMAARTNYLIAIRDLLRPGTLIEIPVYLCDSVLTPVEYGDIFTGGLGKALELKTSAGALVVPREITRDRDTLATFAEVLKTCVDRGDAEDDFIEALTAKRIPIDDEEIHRSLYRQLHALAAAGINGIWANIIRNSFAPLLHDRVDFVVGNPPWVFWNTLPSPYREEIKTVMVERYKLASGGQSTMRRLGSAGKDLSALFVYVALDRYAKDRGRLGFVITQTLFQSTAGDEFRRWTLPGGVPIRIVQVDDWVNVRPFTSAANKTATFVAVRGEETTYPVRYRMWDAAGRFDRDSAPLAEVRRQTTARDLWAHPSNPLRRGSLWTIAESGEASGGRVTASHYRVRRGVETGLESAYRVRPVTGVENGRLLVENIRDRARRPLGALTAEVEISRVYPYVSGASISRWHASSPGNYLVPHTRQSGMKPIPEAVMVREYPLTYEFLGTFEEELIDRPIHRRWGRMNPFYSLYVIGPYTFADWKVVWKRTTRNFGAAVVSSLQIVPGYQAAVIPNGKVMMIPFDSEVEAHYVCAVLNSSLARDRINAAISSEAHAEVLDLISLPAFDRTDKIHIKLAEQARYCQVATVNGEPGDVAKSESEIDRLVACLWESRSSEVETAQPRTNRASSTP